jgi:riboflavin biosynthesis pyrimidine reductase
MRQLLPAPLDEVDLGVVYAYPRELGGRAWVRGNMVSSLDGAAVVDGRSQGLSSDADQKVFALLRGLADAVVVGAGTARIEGYRALRAKDASVSAREALGQSAAPVLVVVSGSLDLDPQSPLFHGGVHRTVVMTHSASDPALREQLAEVADVVVAGEGAVDIDVALDELAARGHARVLCEGGPRLLADIAAAGRLDELCLTVAPRLVGGGATRITRGALVDEPYEVGHLLEQDGTLFARYLRADITS